MVPRVVVVAVVLSEVVGVSAEVVVAVSAAASEAGSVEAVAAAVKDQKVEAAEDQEDEDSAEVVEAVPTLNRTAHKTSQEQQLLPLSRRRRFHRSRQASVQQQRNVDMATLTQEMSNDVIASLEKNSKMSTQNCRKDVGSSPEYFIVYSEVLSLCFTIRSN
jgi:hypothetical protein